MIAMARSMAGPIATAAVWALIGATALGCGGDDEMSSAATNTQTTEPENVGAASSGRDSAEPSARKRRGASVQVRSSRYGDVLFDGKGRALYLFTREQSSRSRCYGDCAAVWPPFFTRGKPRATKGADARLLGTTRRRDGRLQVTYRGHPLYYYVTDRRPGQITCQDVDEFGGTWLVVAPNGNAVQ
jgi:predicted lipoprotein with Yx(FWY)xxD motif